MNTKEPQKSAGTVSTRIKIFPRIFGHFCLNIKTSFAFDVVTIHLDTLLASPRTYLHVLEVIFNTVNSKVLKVGI